MRLFLRIVGVAAFFAMLAAVITVHNAPTHKSKRAGYAPTLTEYADSVPMFVCNDLRGNCRLVASPIADDFSKSIPTPLPQVMTYDAQPGGVTVETTAPPKLAADYASAALQWLMPIVVPIVAGFLVDLIIKVRTYFGQKTTDDQRDRLRSIAENGTNLALHKLDLTVQGKIQLPSKESVMAEAADYVQAHGADTIKALGMDPTDPTTVQAIKGHISTILANKEAAAAPVA